MTKAIWSERMTTKQLAQLEAIATTIKTSELCKRVTNIENNLLELTKLVKIIALNQTRREARRYIPEGF
jgi:hypothetical protein